MKYKISKQDGEFVVANQKGIIIAYCATSAMAKEIVQAQKLDEERSMVEGRFNDQQESRALLASFMAEFA